METIKNYLDNMFQGVPKTSAVERLRQEIYANMEEKYEELKRNGKSEHEAIGIVISEFGNINELLGEFRPEKETPNESTQTPHDSQMPILSLEQVRNYLDVIRKTAKLIGIGVFLILTGVSAMIQIYALTDGLVSENQLADFLPIVPLLVMISIAVGLFIFADHRRADYRFIEEGEFRIMDSVKVLLETEMRNYRSKNMIATIIGVSLCLMGAAIFFISQVIHDGIYSVSLLLLIIGAAVYVFITFGEVTSAYQKLLHLEEYSPEKKKKNKVQSAVASVIFPLAICIFLVWGAVFDGHQINWIVFPVAGMLYGIFCAVYTQMKS